MDLPTTLQVITTAAVVVGVIFGLLQVRQALQARRDYAAVEVVRSVQAQEVQDAVDRILRLPKDADPEVIRSDPALSQAANLVYFAAEMFGSIVYEGVVELHTLDRMVGGWVRATWQRLRRWVEAERVDKQTPNVAEWWQWLYEMLEADPDPGKLAGVHISYRGRVRR
ncbi:MAG TPA: hypothetical protein VFZ06_04400 [Acidimicrobiia bacterium]|nr:hypothetical protein [Acidimicrobiia bacterium]